ncbi:MAG: Na+/H+ antiporter NhaC [Flavobacteriaceae bacterium]|nr:Na+/H+ antiporter NhaC [Flavobacteriaceae bacterium]
MENRVNTDTISNAEERKPLSIWESLIPIVILVIILLFNVKYAYGDDALLGSNQFVLILGGMVATIIGLFRKIPFNEMIAKVSENIQSTTGAILILLMVGALAGTWLLSGIIPSMIYYGLQILHPKIFLVASVIICAVVSIATGSSWTTSATVGIALIGIGETMNIPVGMIAGAVLSGAYFGDKMSPLSDTTNLAPAMAGAKLMTHIKYMTYTTVPSLIVTLIFFLIAGFVVTSDGTIDISAKLHAIDQVFYISPWLFVVPLFVIVLIIKKTEPLIALLLGVLLGGATALIAQPDIVFEISKESTYNFVSAYKGVMNAITTNISVSTTDAQLNELFSSGGMKGMLNTIWLIICAMVFGGIMEAIGALDTISKAILKLFNSIFGLFASTVFSCITLNFTASDQYLAIVVPGKMYAKAFKDKGLAPENLSRTLEDSATVTSVLIPWNTCGAYQSGVLGVPVADYAIYAVFNWLSPFMTLIFAFFRIKIRRLI